MVSMILDFYQFREQVKRAIIQRICLLEYEWDPFAASWLSYALSQDGFEANQPLREIVERLVRWAGTDEAWVATRNLGALCFLGYLLTRMGEGKDTTGFMVKTLKHIERLEGQRGHKFSPVNDPEQVFPMALIVGSMEESPQKLKDFLKKKAQEGMQGTPKRQALFCAALRELGEKPPLPALPDRVDDPGDVIGLVWCWERYGRPGERAKWWGAFASIKDGLSLYPEKEHVASRVLSASEMAMLYEALTRETSNPDPNFLFDLYPLHPRIKEIATSLYKNGEYQNAVEEATKALNAFIQERTGSKGTEAELVQSVMKNFPVPTLQLTPNLETDSGKNEQAGLALITEGVFKAFRNPKAHIPKDAPQLHMDAWEALDQLVIISYVFKRVEKAKIN